jgi:hypothetical protein
MMGMHCHPSCQPLMWQIVPLPLSNVSNRVLSLGDAEGLAGVKDSLRGTTFEDDCMDPEENTTQRADFLGCITTLTNLIKHNRR